MDGSEARWVVEKSEAVGAAVDAASEGHAKIAGPSVIELPADTATTKLPFQTKFEISELRRMKVLLALDRNTFETYCAASKKCGGSRAHRRDGGHAGKLGGVGRGAGAH